MKILILNGPNLNLVGTREPDVYGTEDFTAILSGLSQKYPTVQIEYFQSNHEGEIIDKCQNLAEEGYEGLVINAGALTHYSYSLFDALNAVSIPIVEVHLSHIFSREPFRHVSVISPACQVMISGMGKWGYHAAVEYLVNQSD